jgi:hypothetical protein
MTRSFPFVNLVSEVPFQSLKLLSYHFFLLISKRCSYWSACVSNFAAIGPLLTQERLANQEEENAALQRMLEEQQHVIKLALARILPAKKKDTYFCEVGQQISPAA